MASVGNSMSTTGPMTRATRPTPGCPLVWPAGSVAVAVMSLSLRSTRGSPGGLCVGQWAVRVGRSRCGERVRARHDLADLLGDLGLAGLVGQPGVHADRKST